MMFLVYSSAADMLKEREVEKRRDKSCFLLIAYTVTFRKGTARKEEPL